MLAVRLALAHEAGARLVQVAGALGALEAGGVPLEVGGHAQNVLVQDAAPAARTTGNVAASHGAKAYNNFNNCTFLQTLQFEFNTKHNNKMHEPKLAC